MLCCTNNPNNNQLNNKHTNPKHKPNHSKPNYRKTLSKTLAAALPNRTFRDCCVAFSRDECHDTNGSFDHIRVNPFPPGGVSCDHCIRYGRCIKPHCTNVHLEPMTGPSGAPDAPEGANRPISLPRAVRICRRQAGRQPPWHPHTDPRPGPKRHQPKRHQPTLRNPNPTPTPS